MNIFNRFYSALKEGRILVGIRRRLKPMFIHLGHSVLQRPKIKCIVVFTLNHFPKLKTRIHRILWSGVSLSPRALEIYTELKKQIQTGK